MNRTWTRLLVMEKRLLKAQQERVACTTLSGLSEGELYDYMAGVSARYEALFGPILPRDPYDASKIEAQFMASYKSLLMKDGLICKTADGWEVKIFEEKPPSTPFPTREQFCEMGAAELVRLYQSRLKK